MKDQIKLLGLRSDVFEILQIADVFVHPSFREGLPVSLIEAMAAGLPCIVSNTRGNVDLLEDGTGGYIRQPDDIDGFAMAISNILSDRQSSATMGRHNKAALRRFDIDTVLAEITKIYEGYC